MNDFGLKVQRIVRNKNFVTVVGIILVVVLLFWGYNHQIQEQVNPVSVPAAKETIQPRTKITDDMVELIDMPNMIISQHNNVIQSKNQVVGKYTNVNSVVPEGSMFYTDTVVDKDELPDSVFIKVKKGEIAFKFDVDTESTYGNSIFPGNKIDIYMRTGTGQDDDKVMLGKLISNVEVLAVKDSSGQDVFENTSENRTPSMLIFGLPEDIYILASKAQNMDGVELYPVPRGGKVSSNGSTEVSTQQLADYINSKSVDIPVSSDNTNSTSTTNDSLAPTISVKGSNIKTVTINYPSKCKDTYTCSYTNGTTTKAVNSSKATFRVTSNTTVTANVVDEDGASHTASQDVTVGE